MALLPVHCTKSALTKCLQGPDPWLQRRSHWFVAVVVVVEDDDLNDNSGVHSPGWAVTLASLFPLAYLTVTGPLRISFLTALTWRELADKMMILMPSWE
jgi:hypothetical protein